MPGGSDEAWTRLKPILESIAAEAEGEPCVTHIGHDGAGHFVKMVHNGIEYADMQLIAEAYDLLRRVGGHDTAGLADVFDEWNQGDLESYLIEITAEVLRQKDADTGTPLVDLIVDQAGSKGTGVWTVQNAVGLGIPVSGIGEAVFARAVSSKPTQREAVRALEKGRPTPVAKPEGFEDDVRAALYASKVVAYAQGFDIIIAGAEQYGWKIDKGAVAKIWRAAASSARGSSTGSWRRTSGTPSCPRCWRTSTSRRSSRTARRPGAASYRPRRSPGYPRRASPPRCRTTTRSPPTACRPR